MTNKIVNFLLAVMFLIFAFLQLNDPDPAMWILIYGAMAVVCILAMFKFYSRVALIALLAIYVICSVFYLPGVQEWLSQGNKAQLFDNVAKMEHPFIEESREFLGLSINIVVLVVYLILSRKK
jgi:hypothetical protein